MPVDLSRTLKINEIFYSIQGESTWAGQPCVFVRLTGCPLRCSYCDTAFAYEDGDVMTIDDVVAGISRWSVRMIEITGGEPLAQPGCPELAQCLLDRGYRVLVETSGALPIAKLPSETIKIMDLKCPGSGMCEENDWSNIEALSARDEVKFVIGGREDYEWSREVVQRYNLPGRCREVLFSPVHGVLEPRRLAGWILEDELLVRLQLALHKYIWPPGQRGV